MLAQDPVIARAGALVLTVYAAEVITEVSTYLDTCHPAVSCGTMGSMFRHSLSLDASVHSLPSGLTSTSSSAFLVSSHHHSWRPIHGITSGALR